MWQMTTLAIHLTTGHSLWWQELNCPDSCQNNSRHLHWGISPRLKHWPSELPYTATLCGRNTSKAHFDGSGRRTGKRVEPLFSGKTQTSTHTELSHTREKPWTPLFQYRTAELLGIRLCMIRRVEVCQQRDRAAVAWTSFKYTMFLNHCFELWYSPTKLSLK